MFWILNLILRHACRFGPISIWCLLLPQWALISAFGASDSWPQLTLLWLTGSSHGRKHLCTGWPIEFFQSNLSGNICLQILYLTTLCSSASQPVLRCSVAKKFLDDMELGTEAIRSAVVEFMPYSFGAVNAQSKRFLEVWKNVGQIRNMDR